MPDAAELGIQLLQLLLQVFCRDEQFCPRLGNGIGEQALIIKAVDGCDKVPGVLQNFFVYDPGGICTRPLTGIGKTLLVIAAIQIPYDWTAILPILAGVAIDQMRAAMPAVNNVMILWRGRNSGLLLAGSFLPCGQCLHLLKYRRINNLQMCKR